MPSVSSAHWGGLSFSTSLPADGHRFSKLPHLAPGADTLSSSIDSLSDVDYMSPLSHSFSREDMPFVSSPTIMYDTFTGHNSPIPQSPVSAIMIDHQRAPTSCPSLVYAPSEQGSSLPSHRAVALALAIPVPSSQSPVRLLLGPPPVRQLGLSSPLYVSLTFLACGLYRGIGTSSRPLLLFPSSTVASS